MFTLVGCCCKWCFLQLLLLLLLLLLGGIAHTAYVDAAYCYRPSSVVCLSVCLSVTLVIPAKTAELIKMSFGLRTRVGPGEPCVRWESRFSVGRGNFEEAKGRPIVKYSDTLP